MAWLDLANVNNLASLKSIGPYNRLGRKNLWDGTHTHTPLDLLGGFPVGTEFLCWNSTSLSATAVCVRQTIYSGQEYLTIPSLIPRKNNQGSELSVPPWTCWDINWLSLCLKDLNEGQGMACKTDPLLTDMLALLLLPVWDTAILQLSQIRNCLPLTAWTVY